MITSLYIVPTGSGEKWTLNVTHIIETWITRLWYFLFELSHLCKLWSYTRSVCLCLFMTLKCIYNRREIRQRRTTRRAAGQTVLTSASTPRERTLVQTAEWDSQDNPKFICGRCRGLAHKQGFQWSVSFRDLSSKFSLSKVNYYMSHLRHLLFLIYSVLAL